MAIETTPDTISSSAGRIRRFGRPGVNPVLIKELRSRMRGPRAFLILTGFLLLLSGLAFLLYKAGIEAMGFGPSTVSQSAQMGVVMFMGLAYVELFLVCFITPALTAGTISSEREQLSYDMLMATPLRPSSILLGKMVAALSYVFLLIFAAIPMLSLIYIFGGVTVQDMLVALLILAVTTIAFGLVGVFWSALLQRTGRATVISYLTLIFFILGPYVAYAFYGVLQRQEPPAALLYPSPFTAMASVLGGAGTIQPWAPGFGLLGVGWPGQLVYTHPAWHWTLALYAAMSLLLIMVTVVLVRPVGRRRVTLPQLLFAASLVLALSGLFTFVFSAKDWQEIWTSPDHLRRGLKGMFQPAPGLPMPMPAPAVEIDVLEPAIREGNR